MMKAVPKEVIEPMIERIPLRRLGQPEDIANAFVFLASDVLAASSQESADVAVDKLKEKYPNAIVAGISPNLASMESVRKAFKEATEKYGCVIYEISESLNKEKRKIDTITY